MLCLDVMRAVLPILLTAAAWAAGSLSTPALGQAVDAPRHRPVKVMSFNIRYGTANDGENRWELRRHLVVDTIRSFDPDLLGMQEVLEFQADYLRQQFPGYGFHGVGRDDGDRRGEYVPILFRTQRFEALGSGHFWLSETPEVPGSKSWDAGLTRMVSWVLLRDRESDRRFVFGNTHFDNEGIEARRQSALLIRQRAAPIEAELPILLTGDFNATEDDPAYAHLVGGDRPDRPRWIDAYRAIHPARSPSERTFNNWRGQRTGSRIDWVFHTAQFMTLNAMIDYTQEDGRFPSDHFPVQAVVRLR